MITLGETFTESATVRISNASHMTISEPKDINLTKGRKVQHLIISDVDGNELMIEIVLKPGLPSLELK